ncbi:MAG TPA: hypothetical protein VJN18_32380 [Polyangiaceae bacterium]|nr:hypothetical protein [Polyangiaceae bacterium]
MRVLLDVDGVLGDFPSEVLRFANKYGREPSWPEYSLEGATQHDLLKAWELEHLQKRLDQHMIDTDFCRHMPLYEGAQGFVDALRFIANDLVIVTSSYSDVPTWEHARRAWLKEHFGFEKQNVVFAKRKELVAGNMLLDDKLRNIDAWRNAWGHQGTAVVFDRPWNQGIQFRVRTYNEALKFAAELALKLGGKQAERAAEGTTP